MFKLLHSKLFRQNLFKWIFMYIAALGLLTSVITYSKYITALIHDESVRSSKFIVGIEPYNNDMFGCSDEDGQSCESNVQLRPTKEIEVYFKLDLNQLEVMTNVVLRASAGTLEGNFVQDNGAIPSQMEILRIEEVDKDRNPILKTEEDYINNSVTQAVITTGFKNLEGKRTATASFVFTPKFSSDGESGEGEMDSEKKIKYIKVVAKYKFSEDELNDNNEVDFSNTSKIDEIRIGYSATQLN